MNGNNTGKNRRFAIDIYRVCSQNCPCQKGPTVAEQNNLMFMQIFTKSLMNVINRNGPIIDPCGIPLNTSAQHESSPFTLTLVLVCYEVFNPFNYAVIYFIRQYPGIAVMELASGEGGQSCWHWTCHAFTRYQMVRHLVDYRCTAEVVGSFQETPERPPRTLWNRDRRTDCCCSETESVTAQICSGRNRTEPEPHEQICATLTLLRTRGFNRMRTSGSMFPYASQCLPPPLRIVAISMPFTWSCAASGQALENCTTLVMTAAMHE